jgi:ABC-type phosphate transport system substrate-binding protein
MADRRGARLGRTVRWAIYAAIVVFLWIHRPGGRPLPRWLPGRGEAPAPASLVVAGSDLAPDLVPALLALYARDYPHLTVETIPGGTNRALEALGSGRAAAAFLSRAPRANEQIRFREARGDTVVWHPVAVGGLVLLAAATSPLGPLGMDELRSLATGVAPGGLPPLFAEDPNRGTWTAFRRALATGDDPPTLEAPERVPGVTFLPRPADVVAAVLADPRAIGLVSTFALTRLPPEGTRLVPVAPAADGPAVPPSYEAIGSGEYPLHHRLLVACLPGGDFEGAKLVTHLVSDRGQRQVERAGRLPARRTAREIRLRPGSPEGRSPS